MWHPPGQVGGGQNGDQLPWQYHKMPPVLMRSPHKHRQPWLLAKCTWVVKFKEEDPGAASVILSGIPAPPCTLGFSSPGTVPVFWLTASPDPSSLAPAPWGCSFLTPGRGVHSSYLDGRMCAGDVPIIHLRRVMLEILPGVTKSCGSEFCRRAGACSKPQPARCLVLRVPISLKVTSDSTIRNCPDPLAG